MMIYESHYTYSHHICDDVIAHTDGAVSLFIRWDGIDSELMTEDEKVRRWASLYLMLDKLPQKYCFEFHLWREREYSLANEYLDKGAEMVRAQELASHLRQEHAENLARYARTNTTGVVVVRLPDSSPFFAKKALVAQSKLADELRLSAADLVERLPGGRIASADEYRAAIRQSLNRAQFHRGVSPRYEPQMLLSEQIISCPPREVDGMIELDGVFTKSLLIAMYPDSHPAWFTNLAGVGATIHVSQIIMPTDTRAVMQKAEKESDFMEGVASKRGRDYSSKGIGDLTAFRKLVAELNLSIFRNTYIIQVHGDSSNAVHASVRTIRDWIERCCGTVKDNDYIQLPFFRIAQPGQGYKSTYFRPDHTYQVGDMIPAQVYSTGERHPESLRLGEGSQLIGFNLSSQTIAHSFTAAMTGAGKGVDKGSTIIETYPFGIDWYIAEVGQSYRWTVEGLGGTYTTIDPDKNVVNPLPPFSVAYQDNEDNESDLPLSARVVGGTVGALSFLLNDGNTALTGHQKAAAQMVLQMLYADPDQERDAPTLVDYFQELSTADYFESQQQMDAARFMAENLHSFLSTTEGAIFSKQDNLTLSEGITGVDLKDVMNASEDLLKFYLVFLSLRMAQLAYYRPNVSRILLDEMHVFVKSFPEVVGGLISGVARMGRKEHSFIDLVTQGIAEIDCIENEVINSMPLRTLLYRPDGHDTIAERLSMPVGPLNTWRSFPYPEGLNWRPGLRSVGDRYYNLHMVFSDSMLAMVDTSQLDLKNEIAKQVKDPVDRITEYYRRLRA